MALFGLGWFPWGIWFDLNHRPMKMLLDSMVLFADMDWGSNLEGWVGQRSLWSRIKRLLVEEEWWQWWLTLFNLLPGQLLAGPGRPLDDVGEADAKPDQLPVVVRVHRSRDQTRQEQAFPWKEEYNVELGRRNQNNMFAVKQRRRSVGDKRNRGWIGGDSMRLRETVGEMRSLGNTFYDFLNLTF